MKKSGKVQLLKASPVLVIFLAIGITMAKAMESTNQYQSPQKLIEVSSVINATKIRLKNGETIVLNGLNTIESSDSKSAIEKMLGSNKVIILNKQEIDSGNKIYSADVYVWGTNRQELSQSFDINKLIYHGFLNVKSDVFSGAKKGQALSLNESLVKLGYASQN